MSSSLDLIEDWMEKAERAKYRAPGLAIECQVSQRQLCRYFRSRCRTSPQRWLNEVRMWKAVLQVIERKYVNGIALELHYPCASSFYAHFIRFYGTAPKEFINSSDRIMEFLDRCPHLETVHPYGPGTSLDEIKGQAIVRLKTRTG